MSYHQQKKSYNQQTDSMTLLITHSQVALGNVTLTKAMLKLLNHKKCKAYFKKKYSFPSATWEGVQAYFKKKYSFPSATWEGVQAYFKKKYSFPSATWEGVKNHKP